MNYLKKLALKFTVGFLVKKIQTDEFKEQISNYINKKIDIPKLDEKQEQNLIRAIIDALEIYIVKICS